MGWCIAAGNGPIASSWRLSVHGAWAAVTAPLCVSRRSKALADWIRLALLLAGDVEPNPGPRQRRAIFAVTDLAVGDVTQLTATGYATGGLFFEGYLGVRGLQLESLLLEAGIGAVIMQEGNYLRVCHVTVELSAYHGNTFVAALRRLLLLFQLTGGPVDDVRSTLAPLWG